MRRLAPVLFILVAAALVVAVGAPALVSGLVPAILKGSPPLAGQPVDVRVDASLGGLLSGRLDRVVVTGTGPVALAGASADGLKLDVTDVGLDRSFTLLTGSADGATIPLSGDPITLTGVTMDGTSGTGLRVRGSLDAATVVTRIEAELAAIGLGGVKAKLVDGAVDLSALGQTIKAAFVVEAGSILLRPESSLLPSVKVLAPGGDIPGGPTAVETTSSGLIVTWLVPATSLAALGG